MRTSSFKIKENIKAEVWTLSYRNKTVLISGALQNSVLSKSFTPLGGVP